MELLDSEVGEILKYCNDIDMTVIEGHAHIPVQIKTKIFSLVSGIRKVLAYPQTEHQTPTLPLKKGETHAL